MLIILAISDWILEYFMFSVIQVVTILSKVPSLFRLKKNIGQSTRPEMDLGPYKTSTMKLFCENG